MKRVVFLPENRTVTLGAYVTAWKRALAASETAVFQNGFNWYPESRREVLRQFRRGLHDRINRRIPGFPGTLRPFPAPAQSGRKWQYQWQIETYRAAQQLNHPRLIIDWLPPWLHSQFKHRLRAALID
jgi:hypothetical protein